MLLEVNQLFTQFETRSGTVRAVDGVSFRLDAGETLGLVGESGCGKSVTALSLMRLVPSPPGKIVSGSIRFDGVELTALSDDEMRQVRGRDIAMVFQDPMTSLNPVLTVGRQLTEAMELHLGSTRTQARRRAIELLEMVGIPSPEARIDDYPHQLSGGMRQRVMIAIALSCEPRLILADEITTALDATVQAQILELLAQLAEDRKTAFMLITHDLGIIARMTQRVNVMYAGRIVESADTIELFANPQMPYTWGLLRSVPRLDDTTRGKLTPIDGSPPDLVNVQPGCAFAPRCQYAREVCRSSTPPLAAVAPSHLAACWGTQDTETGGWLRDFHRPEESSDALTPFAEGAS